MDTFEQKYKEALIRATRELDSVVTDGTKNVIQTIFPELKESEDDRIRKMILELVSISGNGNQWEEINNWLEKQKPLNNFDEAEKEKNDFVSGQFIECRKSFNEFEENNSYWLEYIGDDTYIGRSDNVLNKKFHITPRQLFTLFTHEHCPKENNDEQKENNWSDMTKNLDKIEEYVLSLAPNISLDAVKVHAKNIRFLINEEHKQVEWSEEDEDMLEAIECLTKQGRRLEVEHINWLKSLKPNHWKPSEYDISLLEEIARNIRNNIRPFCSEVSALEDLINDLKNL